MTKTELLFILVGLIYVIESASVIIQVISFKTRGGKRVFLMAPIHHHFEKKKWSEVKIVGVFTLITAICATAAYLIS
jgi:phospho-N-acetylmuramoyl-pentapeptide-transferase